MNQRIKNLFKFTIHLKFNILLLLFFLVIKLIILGKTCFENFFIACIFNHYKLSQDFLKPLNTYYPVKVDMISSCFHFFCFLKGLFIEVKLIILLKGF